ncbi:MAG: RHS repeat-associated core domain-containing protein, partial [Phycisphaerae bacterium]
QDANWNVIGLTDLGGSLVERYVYTPYGEITVHQETGYGDRDGDGDVDATDKGTPGSTCTGTVSGACRILDLDFDGDYDATDATKFDSLPHGLGRHPGRIATNVDQPFGHQGLPYEAEIGSYQNRRRQYLPSKRRFMQRDPLSNRNRGYSGYQNGLCLYGYLTTNPIGLNDPRGLAVYCPAACKPDREEYDAQAVCCFEYTNQYCPPGASPECGIRCKKKICWKDEPGPSCEDQCLEKHEEVHFGHFTCELDFYPGRCGASIKLCEKSWSGGFDTDPERECPAYERQLECLQDECEGTDAACRFVRCMIDQMCNPYPGQASYPDVIGACLQDAAQPNPVYEGCDAS